MPDDMLNFGLPGSNGQPIIGHLHLPAGAGKAPVVLLAHGFTAWCDWGFLPQLAEELAAAGIGVIRFSFSHCGITGDGKLYDRPDLFEQDTFSYQVNDTLAIIAAVRDGKLPQADRLDPTRIGMIGHSRGGDTAILASGQTDALKAIITLGSPKQPMHDEEMRGRLRQEGRVAIHSDRTGQDLYVGRAIIDDIDAAGSRYDLLELLRRYRGAYMAVHCQGDKTIPVQDARDLAAAHVEGVTELVIFPRGSHTFNFRAGQRGKNRLLVKVTDKVKPFLLSQL